MAAADIPPGEPVAAGGALTSAAVVLREATETFGHRPEWADVGPCGMGGCNCSGHYDEEVCVRCLIVEYETRDELVTDEHGNDQYVHGRWVVRRDPVRWPCASAVVLGLTERETGPTS